MSTQCRFCGAAIRPNTMFCPSCGQLVVADAPPTGGSILPPPFRTTGGGTRESAAPAPVEVAPPPAPVPLPDAARPAAPARTATVAPPAPVAPAGLALRLPQGVEIAVDRVLVLGRNPAGRTAPFGGEPVEIPDPTRSVSRVHLVVRPGEPGQGTAEDAGSGNGTFVERAGTRHPLRAREPFAIHAGDRLILGDVVVEVGTVR